jgi:NAD(P)H-dependent flavin oxidoreductase YrpB (nitropropane dioxygenase family)
LALPRLIQGGMGVGVSGWALAREVSLLGQLGVVSGTALDTILVRRLGGGDPGGHVRRAMAAFPAPGIARRVLERSFREGGGTGGASSGAGSIADEEAGQRYTRMPLPRAKLTPEREWLLILANFVEVYLAKEGHGGVVGINYLHKIQFPILASVYGAMLAGVDVVLMGAGIPGDIPEVLDRLGRNLNASITLDVLDAGDEKHLLTFDPGPLWSAEGMDGAPALRRPRFLAIVSSATLARALLKKAPGGIDGFVVEAPIAGGHNAPPRGVQQLSHRGEPIYGLRDDADLKQMAGLGVPFWLAGGYATRERFAAALDAGAHGVQVGTAFAFCEESGLDPDLRRRFLAGVVRGKSDVFTDPLASPTSFPFKVAALEGTLSEEGVYARRERLCDLGYLRRAYRRADGTVDYRCPAEPVEDYVHKGGRAEETVGRKCLCNGLLANIGLGQRRADGYEEPALLTAGDDLECIRPHITPERLSYRARDVVEAVLGTA